MRILRRCFSATSTHGRDVGDSMNKARQSISETVAKAQEQAKQTADDVSRKVSDAAQKMKESIASTVSGKPTTPATHNVESGSKEMRPGVMEGVASDVKERGEARAAAAKEGVQSTGESVKRGAADAVERAKESAEHAKDQGESAFQKLSQTISEGVHKVGDMLAGNKDPKGGDAGSQSNSQRAGEK